MLQASNYFIFKEEICTEVYYYVYERHRTENIVLPVVHKHGDNLLYNNRMYLKYVTALKCIVQDILDEYRVNVFSLLNV